MLIAVSGNTPGNQAKIEARNQQQKKRDRKAYAQSQCPQHAVAAASVGDHVVKGRTEAGNNGDDENYDDDAHLEEVRRMRQCISSAATGPNVKAIAIGRWRFEPKLWPSLATGVFVLVTLSLGEWQTRRAQEKLELQARIEAL